MLPSAETVNIRRYMCDSQLCGTESMDHAMSSIRAENICCPGKFGAASKPCRTQLASMHSLSLRRIAARTEARVIETLQLAAQLTESV